MKSPLNLSIWLRNDANCKHVADTLLCVMHGVSSPGNPYFGLASILGSFFVVHKLAAATAGLNNVDVLAVKGLCLVKG